MGHLYIVASRGRRAPAPLADRRLVQPTAVLARRHPDCLSVQPRRRAAAAPRADRRHARRRLGRPRADELARPPVRAVRGEPRADLGRRPDRLQPRGGREHPHLRGRRGRLERRPSCSSAASSRSTAYDARGDALVYAVETHTTSARALHAGTEGRRLTDVGKAFAEGRELLDAERFTAISKDGTEVDAWLMRPAGFEEGRRYPVLLNIHGGPFTQYGTGFFDEFQVYAGRGLRGALLEPARRLRVHRGVGPGDSRADRRRRAGWGTVDYEDVLGVVDTALEKYDFLDPDRLGIIGGSYGGFMTSWVIGHDHRFKAAVSERAVNQMVSAAARATSSGSSSASSAASWYDNIDAWLEHSPATYGRNIETPVLDPPFRAGPPLQHRAGRAPLHDAATPRQGGRDAPLPGRDAMSSRGQARRCTASCASRRSSSGSGATSVSRRRAQPRP